MAPGSKLIRDIVGRRILRQAMQGDDVAYVQARLNSLGYEAGPEDGLYGYLTADAVSRFQAVHGLRQDGITGPQVFAALLSDFALSQEMHIVKSRKEALSQIAESLDVPLTLLAEANQIAPESRPYRTQRLVVPVRTVIGFYLCERGLVQPYFTIERNARNLTFIAPMWTAIDADGYVRGGGPDKVISLALLHEIGIMPVAAFRGNGIPDADAAKKVLASKKARDMAERGIEDLVVKGKSSGVILWLTSVAPEDWYRALSFVSNLAKRLHKRGRYLFVALPPSFSSEEEEQESDMDDLGRRSLVSFPAPYYEGLGRAADQIILLTFDEHTMEGPPGPIASINWVRRAVKHIISFVPCWKVIITAPTYGYDWPQPRRESPPSDLTATRLTHEEISALITVFKPDVVLDPETGSLGFRYRSCRITHQVFFEDERTLILKLDLVHRYHLAGIALYYLGPESSLTYSAIRSKFKVRTGMGRESS